MIFMNFIKQRAGPDSLGIVKPYPTSTLKPSLGGFKVALPLFAKTLAVLFSPP